MTPMTGRPTTSGSDPVGVEWLLDALDEVDAPGCEAEVIRGDVITLDTTGFEAPGSR